MRKAKFLHYSMGVSYWVACEVLEELPERGDASISFIDPFTKEKTYRMQSLSWIEFEDEIKPIEIPAEIQEDILRYASEFFHEFENFEKDVLGTEQYAKMKQFMEEYTQRPASSS